MSVEISRIIEALSIITTNHNLRVTVNSSLKGSVLVALTTFIGGIVSYLNFFSWFLIVIDKITYSCSDLVESLLEQRWVDYLLTKNRKV